MPISAILVPRRTCSKSWRKRSGVTARAGKDARDITYTTQRSVSFLVPHQALSRTGRPCPKIRDVLFYEGLHGAVVTDKIDIAKHIDLKIGVVPVINLEWIQKIHRDRTARGHSREAVTDTILRRMPDYVQFICPQFTETDINFQRVPTVDTSNPFIARYIPTPDESMVVIRFKSPRGIDFPYLLSMLSDSFMSRSELDRRTRRQARLGHATHSNSLDFAASRTQTENPNAHWLKIESQIMRRITPGQLLYDASGHAYGLPAFNAPLPLGYRT